MQTRYFEDLLDTMGRQVRTRSWPEMADEAVAKGCLSSTMVKRAAADRKIKEHRKRSPPHDVEGLMLKHNVLQERRGRIHGKKS
jgi:hypothetical protein